MHLIPLIHCIFFFVETGSKRYKNIHMGRGGEKKKEHRMQMSPLGCGVLDRK